MNSGRNAQAVTMLSCPSILEQGFWGLDIGDGPGPGFWVDGVISFWKRTQPKEISELNSSVIRMVCNPVV